MGNEPNTRQSKGWLSEGWLSVSQQKAMDELLWQCQLHRWTVPIDNFVLGHYGSLYLVANVNTAMKNFFVVKYAEMDDTLTMQLLTKQ